MNTSKQSEPLLTEQKNAEVLELVNNRHSAIPENRKVLDRLARIIANSDKLKEHLK